MSIHSFDYIDGASAGIYTLACLMCGLQLCGHVFFRKWKHNHLVSNMLGIVFLMMAVAGVCYMVSATIPSLIGLMVVGSAIDLMMFTGLACLTHILYTNNQPTASTIILLACPYVVIVGLFFVLPRAWQNHLIDMAMLILMTQYLYYAHRMRRREQLLEDLYSDPESHSLQWIWSVIAINAGWWVLRFLFGTVDCLRDWMYVAAYLYMTGYILFVFTKVVNYGEPVSLATQKALEKHDNEDIDDDVNDKIKRLKTLMIQRQLYLNSDLTVEDVAKCLNASPKYLSTILHNELHTSFAQFVNGYRVERAKQLLHTTDGKVEYIGALCGFNSRQAFRRIFTLHTGVSPTDFRNQE